MEKFTKLTVFFAASFFILMVFGFGADAKLVSSNPIPIQDEENEARAKMYFFDDSETVLMAWFEAMEFCQSRGMEPGRIDSAVENQEVAKLLNDNFQSSHVFWLGATDWGQDGRFYWIRTGQTFQYNNFASGYPNGGLGESCAYVWGDGLWYDQYCTVKEVRPLCQLVN